MIKAYHGTTVNNALKIIQSGVFKKGTWFAFDVKDALLMGGPVVFEREFEQDGFQNGTPESWQFHLREELELGIPPDQFGPSSFNN